MSTHHGHCLCGAVEYAVSGPLRPVVYCHCELCRRTSGHFLAATACPPGNLRLLRSEALRWYNSSSEAQRGFCSVCGANLFWRLVNGAHISILAGTLDAPTGLRGAAHIFVANKSDYYTIDDDLPRHELGDHGVSLSG